MENKYRQENEIENQIENQAGGQIEGPKKYEKEPAAEKSAGNSVIREIISWAEILLAAVILSYCVTHFVLINAEVPSESMETLIEPGDRLFGFRLAYTIGEPKRFDVVIFKYPVDESQNFIKRVIGLPGETVEIREGKIYIDGAAEPLDEDYLPEEWVVDNDDYYFEVPTDCYLMLGDNRNISLDARFWAEKAIEIGEADNFAEAQAYTYVRSDQIIGRAIIKYYPKIKLLL